jgi:hypothetical protein
MTGYWVPATGTIGRRMPARTIGIPHLHDARRRTRVGQPHLRSKRTSLHRHWVGKGKHSGQHQPEIAHLGLPWAPPRPTHNGSAASSRHARQLNRRAEVISQPLLRPVQPGPDPRRQLILAHLEHASGSLDLRPDASSRYEGARECRIREVNRDRVIQHAAHP